MRGGDAGAGPRLGMFNIGTQELLIILFVVLLLFGAKRIPEVARSLGKGVGDFRDALSGVEREIKREARNVAREAAVENASAPAAATPPAADPPSDPTADAASKAGEAPPVTAAAPAKLPSPPESDAGLAG
jgi:sec-independent protein translocase protein TatA